MSDLDIQNDDTVSVNIQAVEYQLSITEGGESVITITTPDTGPPGPRGIQGEPGPAGDATLPPVIDGGFF